MTFTPLSSIQSGQGVVQKGPLLLNQGQVFRGTIQKLYPDNQAEIQIGEHKLVAKLETPLKAGDAHFFQVTSTKPEMRLKVVSDPVAKGTSIEQMMASLNLPKSKEMGQILAHFVKNQLPISKEQLLQVENWIKQLPDGVKKQEALLALGKQIQLKAPMTKEVFHALLFGAKKSGITGALEQLSQLLKQTEGIPQALKMNLLQQLQGIKNPFEAETVGLVLSRSVQTLLSANVSIDSKEQIFHLLKQVGIVPKSLNLNLWLSQSYAFASKGEGTAGKVLHDIMNSANWHEALKQVKNWIEQEQNLTAEQKNNLIQSLQSFGNQSDKKAFLPQFHQQLLKAFAERAAEPFPAQGSNVLGAKEQLLSLMKNERVDSLSSSLTQIGKALYQTGEVGLKMVAEAEQQIQSNLSTKAIERGIQTVLQRLGVSYEALLKQPHQMEQTIQSLKPQLLTLIQDGNTPLELKNGAEQLLARFNGMQLLSGENGHQHQIIMQIPLQFFGKQVDATIEWNGKMGEDGKIDADYARVLFYLNMETLKETVIDMQVQNRIVTLHIYNDNHGLERLAEPLKIALKKGLQEKNYQLSGVIMKPLESSNQPKEHPLHQKNLQPNTKRVDIRI